MNHYYLSPLDSCSTQSNMELAAWAQLEGKSETMSADLLRSTLRQRKEQQRAFTSAGTLCPRCIASAAIGAAIAMLLDRIIVSGY